MSARRMLLAAGLALMVFVQGASAQPVSEPAVKAAFLYKFLGYVEWPAQAFAAADSPYVVGILGAEEVAAEFERLVPGRAVNGRRVVVRRLREGDLATGVHLVFVGRGAPLARDAIRTVQRPGVLVVSDAEGGLEAGSAINLVTVEDRVGFEVSLDAAERAGIAISSRMLAVARRVVPKGGA